MLTKTEFLRYLHCPQSAWLKASKPDAFPKSELSLFDKKIISDGYEVEAMAEKLFPGGVTVTPGPDAAVQTRGLLAAGHKVLFQPTFETDDGLHVRGDILQIEENGNAILHEVKSSTGVKTDAGHNHIKDACFQYITLARAGFKLDQLCLIHLNRSYIRQGAIEPAQLLTLTEITEDVLHLKAETETEIDAALAYLKQPRINETFCSCIHKTRGNRCDSFSYFNPQLPDNSIYDLARLHPAKMQKLLDLEISAIADIPEDFELSGYQDMQRFSLIEDEPVIDLDAVEGEFARLSWPLYFIDYETFASAVPKIDRAKPHQAIPFQYSLHVLHDDGTLEEFGFIADQLELPSLLIETMQSQIGARGSLISWHASFEKLRNEDMALLFPEHEVFLNDMNSRTYDLERIFKAFYVDAKFKGSSSIKKVLPVLLPQFSYAALAIQDGTSAMEAWHHMTKLNSQSQERETIRRALLEYCALDTLAMVEIYRYLRKLIDQRQSAGTGAGDKIENET